MWMAPKIGYPDALAAFASFSSSPCSSFANSSISTRCLGVKFLQGVLCQTHLQQHDAGEWYLGLRGTYTGMLTLKCTYWSPQYDEFLVLIPAGCTVFRILGLYICTYKFPQSNNTCTSSQKETGSSPKCQLDFSLFQHKLFDTSEMIVQNLFIYSLFCYFATRKKKSHHYYAQCFQISINFTLCTFSHLSLSCVTSLLLISFLIHLT